MSYFSLALYISDFCDNIWGYSYSYAPEGEPCIVMEFEGRNPNVHGNSPWKMGLPDSCPKDPFGPTWKVIAFKILYITWKVSPFPKS